MPTNQTRRKSGAWQTQLSGVWVRIALLFGGLLLLKILLLAELRQHLMQAHWRTDGFVAGWLDHTAFVVFVGLIIVALLLLSRHCERLGPGVVRRANLVVLGLATLFIFLTFHEGDTNYLYPVLKGVLDVPDLGSYLMLDLFFRPPYLSAWAFLYTLTYWALVRSGRAHLILRVTAGFAGAYVALCLRELPYLQAAPADLLIVDALGLAALAGLWKAKGPLSLGWAAVIIGGWLAVFWGILASTSSDLADPAPYFISLTASIAAAMLATGLVAARSGFLKAWSWMVPFVFSALFLFGNNHYPQAASLNRVLDVAMAAPRYLMGETLVVGVIALGAVAWRKRRPMGSLLLLDLLCVGLLMLALVDLRLTQIMGVRLDWDVISFGHSPKMMFRVAREYLPAMVAGLAFVCVGYVIGVRILSKTGGSTYPVLGCVQTGAWRFAVTAMVLLAAIGWLRVKPDKALGQSVLKVAASTPAWRQLSRPAMSEKEFEEEARKLGMTWEEPRFAMEDTPSTNRLNLVFILLESTYNKHLSLFGGNVDTQPLLSQYQDRMELFPNFYANFMGSIQARFACFTGLHPVRDYYAFTLNRVPVRSLFEVMQEHGYLTSMFYSSYFDYTCFRDFLTARGLDEMYDADTMPGAADAERVSWGVHEEDTLDAIKQKIGQYAAQEDPFFLTYIPACPHHPYDSVPSEFQRYKVEEFQNVTPHYHNSLLYMDWVVASIVGELEQQGLLDRTLIIITGDHGEMLGEDNGRIGHGWKVTPELANVPLIVMDPRHKGRRINPTVGSHVDLLPTITRLTGVSLPVEELYQGHDLFSPREYHSADTIINSYSEFAMIHGELFCQMEDDGAVENSRRATHRMAAVGARPVFEEVETPCEAHPTSSQEFNRFQESFLRTYGRYRQTMGARHSSISVASAVSAHTVEESVHEHDH